MENDLAQQITQDIAKIKERISNISQLDLSQHSTSFEEIHALLQQALANLDGI
jgi:hypothetical protein